MTVLLGSCDDLSVTNTRNPIPAVETKAIAEAIALCETHGLQWTVTEKVRGVYTYTTLVVFGVGTIRMTWTREHGAGTPKFLGEVVQVEGGQTWKGTCRIIERSIRWAAGH